MTSHPRIAAAAAIVFLFAITLPASAADAPATTPAAATDAAGDDTMNVYVKIAAQAVNFLIFAWLLSRLLIKPVRKMMKERHDQMEADRRKAEEERAQADKIREKAEAAARELEAKRDDVLQEARDQADAERKKRLEEADQQGQDRLERFRRIMEQERDELMQQVGDELRDTIFAVSGAALRDAAGALTDRAIDRLGAKLDELSDADRETAQQAVASDEPVKVISAAELDDERTKRLRDLLAEKCGGENVELDVDEDASLLAGLEVHLGHLRVQAHWRREVEEALASMDAQPKDATDDDEPNE
jgi:F-type H+-transporting ATPase subunit b